MSGRVTFVRLMDGRRDLRLLYDGPDSEYCTILIGNADLRFLQHLYPVFWEALCWLYNFGNGNRYTSLLSPRIRIT